jgi:Up-Regulated in long-lived daf-2
LVYLKECISKSDSESNPILGETIMLKVKQSVVLASLALVGASFLAPVAAEAKTMRTAHVVVQNATGYNLEFVTVAHKYSSDYKEAQTWGNLPNGQITPSPLSVRYNTGAFTTGRDWWSVAFRVKGSRTVYVTNPNNFRSFFDFAEKLGTPILGAAGQIGGSAAGSYIAAEAGGTIGGKIGGQAGQALGNALFNAESTVGFKAHTLRGGDEASRGGRTVIRIERDQVKFISPSGTSTTVFNVVK